MMKKITKWLLTFLTCALFMAMTVMAADGTVSVTSSVIDSGNTAKVTVKAEASAGISSDDGKLYLFAVPTYVDSVKEQTPVTSVSYSGKGTYTFSTDLNANTENSLLYSKFYVGVKSGGSYTALTDGNFITNPEVIASSQAARTVTASKKGIHMTLSIPTDLQELGIDQSFFNVSLEDFISNTKTDISYIYNGKTYYFTSVVNEYDNLISNMSDDGIAVTVTLINKYKSGYEYMLMPNVSYREGTANYAFNTSTQQGLETLAAATHFLAERYNGTDPSHGKVDNWIIGNEVNDNSLYYYMGSQKVDPFVQEYAQSFRVMYTAVKSAYSNANVYLCLEHRWNTENSTTDYAGKSFIDKFNSCIKAQGNLDWGLSYHPYSYPMNDADILNDGEISKDGSGNSTYGGEVLNSIDTPIITMKNLSILTDYFHNSELLSPSGEVRSIILGEQGYTSYSNITGQNEAKQAANIALAYYIAEMNEDVDAFLLRTLTDENEGSTYYKFGLRNVGSDGYPADAKFAYEMYKYINTHDSLEYTEFAKSALNISDWSSVVPNWNANVLKSMGTRTEEKLYTASAGSDSKSIAKGMDQWEVGYNVFDIGFYDYVPFYYADGVAVANSFAYYKDYQGIEIDFSSAYNLSSAPYLTFDANFKAKDSSGANDKLELKVKVHSGDDVYDAVGIVNANKDYSICLDLSQWSGRSSIDKVEVLIREYGAEKSFCGTFTIYNLAYSSKVSNQKALDTITTTYTDLSDAELTYQTSFEYKGSAIEPEVTVKLNDQVLEHHKDYDVIYHDNVKKGTGKIVVVGIGSYRGNVNAEFTIQNDYTTTYNGVDYGLVYAYGYYKDNNPDVVAEVGTDPDALLEHFVTVGMKYALQGIGSFNVMAYAQFNSDLGQQYGDDWSAYYLHYIQFGQYEGRATSGKQPDGVEAPVYPGSGSTGDGGSTDDNGSIDSGSSGTESEIATTPMYRLYNPNSGEHFYTGSTEERDMLDEAGWNYEGVAWNAPIYTGEHVHRLYNPNSGDHHYTMSQEEVDMLVGYGWQYEGVAWNSIQADTEGAVAQLRLYNPNADCGSHHYTSSQEECDMLVAAGWILEGTGWFGLIK